MKGQVKKWQRVGAVAVGFLAGALVASPFSGWGEPQVVEEIEPIVARTSGAGMFVVTDVHTWDASVDLAELVLEPVTPGEDPPRGGQSVVLQWVVEGATAQLLQSSRQVAHLERAPTDAPGIHLPLTSSEATMVRAAMQSGAVMVASR